MKNIFSFLTALYGWLLLLNVYPNLINQKVFAQSTSIDNNNISNTLNKRHAKIKQLNKKEGVLDGIRGIAEKITVRIDYGNQNGSGVIIAKDGNIFHVLTAYHVVENADHKYEIITPDGLIYSLDYTTVKKIDNSDLAILQFQSDVNYDIAILANFNQREDVYQTKIQNYRESVENNQSSANEANLRERQLVEAEFKQAFFQATQHCSSGKIIPLLTETELKKSQQCFRDAQEGNRELQVAKNKLAAFRANPSNSVVPRVEVDYQLNWLLLYGWSRFSGTPQPYFSFGNYYKSNLEENLKVSIEDFFAEFQLQILTPNQIFTENDNSKDNFNQSSRNYDLFYTNKSFGGMSGGPILDHNGYLVAIHTGIEGEEIIKFPQEFQLFLGYSSGIFITKFLNVSEKLGIKSNLLKFETTQTTQTTPINEDKVTALNELVHKKIKSENLKTAVDWVNYGNQLWRLQKYDESIEAFNQAIKINPDLHLAHFGKGVALETLAFLQLDADYLWDEAYEEHKIATKIKSDFYPAWKKQGDYLRKLTASEAKEITALPIEEQRESYENKMNPKRALALTAYENALQGDPEDAYLHARRGEMLFLLNRCEEALEAYNKSIEIHPSPVYHKHRGFLYLALGEHRLAKSDFRISLEDPESTNLHPLYQYRLERIVKDDLSGEDIDELGEDIDEAINRLLVDNSLDRCKSNIGQYRNGED